MQSSQLIGTDAELERHFQKTNDALEGLISERPYPRLSADWARSPLVAGLTGQSCEFVTRNRGAKSAVTPLIELRKGLWAWFGYREEWDEERANRNVRRFSFRSAGITVHFGFRSDVFKPQVFRAEWAGWARWNGTDLSFQAGAAGHPHWQFDILDSLTRDDDAERAKELLELLSEDADEGRDFAQMTLEDTREMILRQPLSRVHFASAAAWWKPKPNDDHAHCPSKMAEIENWMVRTLEYVTVELRRLGAT